MMDALEWIAAVVGTIAIVALVVAIWTVEGSTMVVSITTIVAAAMVAAIWTVRFE